MSLQSEIPGIVPGSSQLKAIKNQNRCLPVQLQVLQLTLSSYSTLLTLQIYRHPLNSPKDCSLPYPVLQLLRSHSQRSRSMTLLRERHIHCRPRPKRCHWIAASLCKRQALGAVPRIQLKLPSTSRTLLVTFQGHSQKGALLKFLLALSVGKEGNTRCNVRRSLE